MHLLKLSVSLLVSLAVSCVQAARVPQYQQLPPLREQAAIQDAWTVERVSNVPQLLRKYEVDAWLMSQKEYAEDTVFWSLKSATQFSARRRTVDLFLANTVEDASFSYNWIDNTPEVWSELRSVLEAHNVSSIAVNADTDVAFSSGLHVGEFGKIVQELGPEWEKKLVVEPMVGVEFIGTMVPGRLEWYRRLQETAWAIITEAFSEAVIEPGITTTDDVRWWMRDKIQQLNYTTWFMPDVSILNAEDPFGDHPMTTDREVIQYGDLLHCDFGVTALGLNTDTQHMAYVLYPGESEDDIPEGYIGGLKQVNRLQDIVKSNMKVGTTGNDILKTSLKQMRNEGFDGKIYCHPIGDWGHSAGTLIGMFNLQEGVEVLGDLPLLDNTYYSVELYAEYFVAERNQTMNFYQEEDVYWNDEIKDWDWVWGRQEKFHLVRPPVDRVFRVQGP
ncbi:hypothetical protein LHYA1_G003401 [Lachnellula hyalina]|uniref:Peptidase M24 domain-containing protein n=1 Tax=Lachnellula hyalina TaxID=1316788 RepID=A0A8H8R2L4_9HELO|nr:uncharacterized protein LHYA1_G003401 [Lachnellula hyalina]TVY27269.1 hypothetical protein LHYA1_G003401 [Lachnellula hyalina]